MKYKIYNASREEGRSNTLKEALHTAYQMSIHYDCKFNVAKLNSHGKYELIASINAER